MDPDFHVPYYSCFFLSWFDDMTGILHFTFIILNIIMKEDIKDYREFFSTYATGNTYSFRQGSQPRSGGNQPQRQFRQPAKKLPIIYANQPRSSTPTKQPNSSRVIYGDRDQSQKQISSSPVVKYQSGPFNQARVERRIPSQYALTQQKIQQALMNQMLVSSPADQKQNFQKSDQGSSRSRTLIAANLVESRPVDMMNINSSFDPNHRVQVSIRERMENKVEIIGGERVENQRSRVVTEASNIPSMPNVQMQIGNNVVRSYVTSEVIHNSIPEFGQQNHSIPSTNMPIQGPFHNNIQSHPPNSPLNGLTFSRSPASNISAVKVKGPSKIEQSNEKLIQPNELITKIMPNTKSQILTLPQTISNLSAETVPRVQFDKCINECKNWQTKYNQLYLKYMNLASSFPQQNQHELSSLQQQNYRLKQQLRQQQDKMKSMIPKLLESKFIEMVDNQKQSTIKQSMLLMERYRLQSRQNRF